MVRSMLGINLLLALVVATTVFLLRGRIAGLFDEAGLTALLSVGFLYLIFRTLNTYSYYLCQGFNEVDWSARQSVVTDVGTLVSMLLFLGLGMGATGALLGYVFGYVFGAAFGLVFLFRLVSRIDDPSGDGAAEREQGALDPDGEGRNDGPEPAGEAESNASLLRRIISYCVPLTVTSAAEIFYKRVDILLIGYFLAPVVVGYYTLAKQLTEFVTAPASSLGFALSPSFGEYKSSGNLDRAARVYETTLEYTLLCYVPAAAGIYLVADPAVRYVFGDGYLGAIPLVQILSVFVVLQAINRITNDTLDYLGRARGRAVAKGGTALLNFGLNLVVIPVYGAAGATVATVGSYAIMLAVNLYLIDSELPLSRTRVGTRLGRVCAVALVMSAVVSFSQRFVTDLPTLIGSVLLGGTTWLLLSVSMGLVDVDRLRTELI
jgi:O-antigen/teichoic acid export membrane protein